MGGTGNLDLVQNFLFAGGPAAVACLGWWLSGRFRAIEQAYMKALAIHEADDERRHIENLGRFGEINERLARMGNGHDSTHSY